MKITHTPGPWAFRGKTLVQDFGNRKHIGEFSEAPGLGHEAAQNLALIAAAPELLQLLRDAMGGEREECLVLTGVAFLCWQSKARAAIRKIEGKDKP